MFYISVISKEGYEYKLEVPDFPSVVICGSSMEDIVKEGQKKVKEQLDLGVKAEGYSYEKIITDPRYRKVIAFKHIYPGGED